ncbi:hypothetical protein RSOLAG1IB_11592 [Rhizoctonia solani AG-1 IB]|uniref:DUF6532 domain-containing protein n=1 Tax=Thanatephorus cucumeris (strain AG1-IB / isolate 7/3/14) TaxID=1108050 RepID=M5C9D3_THACB|nr:hypothetical protein BN14_10086 [Rhizoctonia solani AG-1 IB]CEL54194.1 hypothetical protein RSOLAG1IB_11592 [Rhizoctonia solani AG-1 IB]
MTNNLDSFSLARDRARRLGIAVPERAIHSQQELARKRDNNSKRTYAQIVQDRPQPRNDSDDFTYTIAEPAPISGIDTRRNIDETDAREEEVRSYLQHIAIRDGRDLRAEYEAGSIGLSGLKALARGDPLLSTPSPDTEPEVPSPPIPGHSAPSVPTEASGGAKAIATAFEGANAWPGITIQSKSVDAVRSRFAGNGYNPRETNPVPRLRRTDRETIMSGTPTPQVPQSQPPPYQDTQSQTDLVTNRACLSQPVQPASMAPTMATPSSRVRKSYSTQLQHGTNQPTARPKSTPGSAPPATPTPAANRGGGTSISAGGNQIGGNHIRAGHTGITLGVSNLNSNAQAPIQFRLQASHKPNAQPPRHTFPIPPSVPSVPRPTTSPASNPFFVPGVQYPEYPPSTIGQAIPPLSHLPSLSQHNAQSQVQMAHQVQPTWSNPVTHQASLSMAEQPMPMDPRMPGVTNNSVPFDQQAALLAQSASLPAPCAPNTQTTTALPFRAPAFSTQPQQYIQVSQRPPPLSPSVPYAPRSQTIQPYTVELNPNPLFFPTASTAPTCTGPTQGEPNAVPIVDADTRNGEEREAAGDGANLTAVQQLDEDSNLPAVRFSTICDFNPAVRPVLKTFVRLFKAWNISRGSYQYDSPNPLDDTPSHDEMAIQSWHHANKVHCTDLPFDPDYMKPADATVCAARSIAKSLLLPVVQNYYGFRDDDPAHNSWLKSYLLPNRLHCGIPDEERKPMESPFFIQAARTIGFQSTNSMGFRHRKFFAPPHDRFLAFIYTITYHIVYCYGDNGVYQQQNLSAPLQESTFANIMKGTVEKARKRRPIALRNFLVRIYDRCMSTLVEPDAEAEQSLDDDDEDWSSDDEEVVPSSFASYIPADHQAQPPTPTANREAVEQQGQPNMPENDTSENLEHWEIVTHTDGNVFLIGPDSSTQIDPNLVDDLVNCCINPSDIVRAAAQASFSPLQEAPQAPNTTPHAGSSGLTAGEKEDLARRTARLTELQEETENPDFSSLYRGRSLDGAAGVPCFDNDSEHLTAFDALDDFETPAVDEEMELDAED